MKALLTFVLLFHGLFTFSHEKALDSLVNLTSIQQGAEKVQTLNELSWHYKNSNPDSAILLARQAHQLVRLLKNQDLTAMTYNSLGNAYQSIGDYDSALYYLRYALQIRLQQGDSVNLPKILNNIGICHDEKADYEEALKNYFQALQIAELHHDLHTSAMLLGNIGIVYKKQEDYEMVLKYYEKALDIYKQLDAEFGIAATTGNIGSVYLQLKDFHQAIAYSRKAQKLYEQLGYSRYVPYVVGNAAIASDSLSLKERAEMLYLQAIAGHQAHDNKYELAFQYKNLSSFYFQEKKLSKAQDYLNQSLVLAEAIGANEMLKDALKLGSEIYAGLMHFEKAYALHLKYEALKDSLFQIHKTRQIYELQTKYETEKKEQRIALQQSEIAEQTAENQRNLIFIGGLVCIIILLTVIFLLVRSRLRKQQMLIQREAEIRLREAHIETTIASQEKERTRFAKDLHDGFGQMISILNLNLKSLEDGDKDRHTIFKRSTQVLEDMYQELKSICFNLMPQTLIQHGLEPAIREFAGRINATGKLFVATDVFGLDERLTDVQEISLYRIIQEWVNNIMKYSDADKITIQITRDEAELTLLIEDNGVGFDTSLLKIGKGNGWRNMQTRINLIKGELEIDSTPGVKGSALIVNARLALTPSEKSQLV